MKLFTAVLPFALLLAACADEPKIDRPRSQMTQYQRDSTIAESGLPGSGVVKKGLNMADGQARRAAMIDSITDGN